MTIRILFNAFAFFEILTGIAALVLPGVLTMLVFGVHLQGASIALTRILGIALITLGIAAWQPSSTNANQPGRIGLLVYNGGLMIFLPLYAVAGGEFGPLLWPIAVVHTIVGLVILRTLFIPDKG